MYLSRSICIILYLPKKCTDIFLVYKASFSPVFLERADRETVFHYHISRMEILQRYLVSGRNIILQSDAASVYNDFRAGSKIGQRHYDVVLTVYMKYIFHQGFII